MKKLFALLFLGSLSLQAATIYVRKSGDDTTGTGLTGAPYLTVGKAESVAASGDTIKIGAGTYVETNQLTVNAVYAALTTYESESGSNDVTITGASGALNLQSISSNVKYHNLNFLTKAATDTSGAARIQAGTGVIFDGCTFTATPSGANLPPCILISPSASQIGAVSLLNCTFNQTGTGNSIGINWTGGTALLDSGQLTVSNCTIVVEGTGIQMINATNLTIRNCDITASGTASRGISCINPTAVATRSIFVADSTIASALYGFQVGVGTTTNDSPAIFALTNVTVTTATSAGFELGRDAAYTNITAGTITGGATNCVVHSSNHGILIGADTTNVVVTGCTAYGDYAYVLKECNNPTVKNCIGYGINGTPLGGIYFKGCTNAVATGNLIYVPTGSIPAFKRNGGDAPRNTPVSGGVFTNNVCVIYGGMGINAPGTDDAGGGICDYNIYIVGGAAADLGDVNGTTGITTIKALRSAWGGYTPSGNDSHSWHGPGTPDQLFFP